MTDGHVARRVAALALLAVMCGTALTGCIIGDFKESLARLDNRRTESVTLQLTGLDIEPQEFAPRRGTVVAGQDDRIEGDACEGDGFIVTDTATGNELGRSDEPVCGDTRILVEEDGTVSP